MLKGMNKQLKSIVGIFAVHLLIGTAMSLAVAWAVTIAITEFRDATPWLRHNTQVWNYNGASGDGMRWWVYVAHNDAVGLAPPDRPPHDFTTQRHGHPR